MPDPSPDCNAPSAVGICLGASTISAVRLIGGNNGSGERPTVEKVVLRAHEGNPRAALEEVVADIVTAGSRILVTGRRFREFVALPSLTEPEAVEHALAFVVDGTGARYDAVVSAGGETFMVYGLDRAHRIAGVSTGNKCASGTGEFFLQQIRRLDLGVDEAVALASASGTPYPVSGRCSVFCKSDCTHALNKGEPKGDVTAGLCQMIAGKIVELLARMDHGRVLMVGGTAQNTAVVDFLRKKVPEVVVPVEAPYFEALGAALAAVKRGVALPESLFASSHHTFSFLPPLCESESLVTFNTVAFDRPRDGDCCILGLDVGSTTTKAVLVRAGERSMLASVYLRTNGNPIEASRACLQSILRDVGAVRLTIQGLGVTGSGRHIAGLYTLTDGVINEIIAHATAAAHFDPEVDTIFEIGGQDAKYTSLASSVASDYAMNEACSAGTGSFLEESAYESLGVPTKEIADKALRGARPPNFSDQCAAFISSDIKNAVHEGLSQEDILAGLVYSICFNYANRVKGNRPVGKKVFMQGGVCYNRAVPLAMASILRKPIVVPPEPGLMGAYGVALEVERRQEAGLLERGEFHLAAIVQRAVEYEKPFVCAGGAEKCDRKCEILRIRMGGTLYPFGGACDKYYGSRRREQVDVAALDQVSARNETMFGYAQPGTGTGPVVGLNRSFLTLSMYPLYATFLTQLGCRIVMPDTQAPGAAGRLATSMCYPAEVAAGYFEDLLARKPDWLLIPHAKELPVPNGIDRVDFNCTCAWSQGEGFWLRQAFRGSALADKLLIPTVNMGQGYEAGREGFVGAARTMGFSRAEADVAFDAALRAQEEFHTRCGQTGERLLAQLRADPERIGIVVFGRPYNAYVPEANKSIPRKFASRGHLVIPYDMLPYGDEPLGEDYANYMHWEAGQRILRAARIVERDEQLFGLYITNFLCAPDSFLVPFFRRVMGRKPSLTLELDAHTADAGVNTRIDAFLDIVHNHRQGDAAGRPGGGGRSVHGVHNGEPSHRQGASAAAAALPFQPAKVVYEHGGAAYVDSAGRRFAFTDPAVKLVIPPMGDMGSAALAAACRRVGVRAQALPRGDADVLRIGRGATSCKECLPMTICLGALLTYLQRRPAADAGEKLMILIPKAAGYCRLGQYHVYTSQYIREHRIPDVAILDLGMEEQFAGLGARFTFHAWKAIMTTDVLDDIGCALRALAVDREAAMRVFDAERGALIDALEHASGSRFSRRLAQTARTLRAIPLVQPLDQTAAVGVTGEFFVRKDPFSNLGIAYRLADRGFVVKTAAMAEWVYYVNFLIKERRIEPHHTLASKIEFVISDATQRVLERRIKRILSASGLYHMEMIDIREVLRHAEPVVPLEFHGEPALIAGFTMREGIDHLAGVVNVGPFGCMQTRFGDAITIPGTDVKGKRAAMKHAGRPSTLEGFEDAEKVPFLSIESDGNPYPQLLEARFESFCLQAERMALRTGKRAVARSARI